MNEVTKSKDAVADDAGADDMARPACAAADTESREQTLGHVLECSSCLASLTHTLGARAICALIQPHLDAYIRGTLNSKGLRRLIGTHLRTCAVCYEDLQFAQQRKEIAELADTSVQAGVRLALALIDAALDDQSLARRLLLDWLGIDPHAGRGIARRATKLKHRAAVKRAREFLAVPAITPETAVRQIVLRFLARQADLLEELDLYIDHGKALRESTSAVLPAIASMRLSFEPHPGTVCVPGWMGAGARWRASAGMIAALVTRWARRIADAWRFAGAMLFAGLHAGILLE
jgi:hypothetical protein